LNFARAGIAPKQIQGGGAFTRRPRWPICQHVIQ
jgi:hypothetical protein